MIMLDAKRITPSNAAQEDAMRANQVSILARLTEHALGTSSYDELLDSITGSLTDIFSARDVRLYLSSSEALYLRELSGSARVGAEEESLFLPSGTGRIDQLMNRHQVVIMDCHAPHPKDVMVDLLASSGFYSGVVAPIFTSQRNLGMYVLMLDRIYAWSRRDVEFLLAVGRTLGALIERGQNDGVTIRFDSLRECDRMIGDIEKGLRQILDSVDSGREGASSEKSVHNQYTVSISHDACLSYREKDIMRYVAQGLTNNEIAELTFVSESTIKRQLADLLSKLNLRNRAHLAAYAVRTGIAE